MEHLGLRWASDSKVDRKKVGLDDVTQDRENWRLL